MKKLILSGLVVVLAISASLVASPAKEQLVAKQVCDKHVTREADASCAKQPLKSGFLSVASFLLGIFIVGFGVENLLAGIIVFQIGILGCAIWCVVMSLLFYFLVLPLFKFAYQSFPTRKRRKRFKAGS